MNTLRWFFMSKYNKLMYHINVARKNGSRLHLENGIILDFEEGIILNSKGKQIKCIYRWFIMYTYRILIGVNDKYLVGAKGVTKEEAEMIEQSVKQNPKADVKIVEEVA